MTKSTLEWLAEIPGVGGPDHFDPAWDAVDRPPLGALFYDREGEPISMRTWAKLHGHEPYVRVGEDTIGPYWVSTVWLGIDYSCGGVPMIFETMIFNRETNESDLACRLYASEQAAEAGHAAVVNEVRLMVAASDTDGDDRDKQ